MCYEKKLQEKVVSLLFKILRSKKWVKGKLGIKKKSLSFCNLRTYLLIKSGERGSFS